jgi:hypothetical protein
MNEQTRTHDRNEWRELAWAAALLTLLMASIILY